MLTVALKHLVPVAILAGLAAVSPISSQAAAPGCKVAELSTIFNAAISTALANDTPVGKAQILANLRLLLTSPQDQAEFAQGFQQSMPGCTQTEVIKAAKLALTAVLKANQQAPDTPRQP